MTNEIVVAVMSDLHCRHGKDAKITTHLYTELPAVPKEQHPIEALKDLIQKNGIKADILLCPGDIADKADRQGLSSGWGFVKAVAEKLASETLVATVGNHDIETHSPDAHHDTYSYLTNFSDDYPMNENVLRDAYFQTQKPYCIITTEKYLILNFNSCYNHRTPAAGRRSMITDAIISLLRQDLAEYDQNNVVRIALFHHHPKQYANHDVRYKDEDIIDRGELLLSLLEEKGFNLVVHGHKHIPRLDYFNNRLPVFCAGSFSSLENVSERSGKNTFHIIRLKQTDRNCIGKIDTWSFAVGKGWSPILDSDFFPKSTGFSNEANLENIIESVSQMVSDGVVKYSELIRDIPLLQNLTPQQQDYVGGKLLTDFQIEFSPGLKEVPKFVAKQVI